MYAFSSGDSPHVDEFMGNVIAPTSFPTAMRLYQSPASTANLYVAKSVNSVKRVFVANLLYLTLHNRMLKFIMPGSSFLAAVII